MSRAKQVGKSDIANFFRAASKGDVVKLNALLKTGHQVDQRDGTGRTALMHASEHGKLAAVRALLVAGASVNASVTDRDSIWFGCNALIFAARSGNAELVEALLQAGCSPGCKAADSTTPLTFAAEHRSSHMVEASDGPHSIGRI